MSKRTNAPVVSRIANSSKATRHGKMTRLAIGVRFMAPLPLDPPFILT